MTLVLNNPEGRYVIKQRNNKPWNVCKLDGNAWYNMWYYARHGSGLGPVTTTRVSG